VAAGPGRAYNPAWVISPELATFLQSGVSVLVGTRGPDGWPDAVRAVGARVEPGGADVTVFLPESQCAAACANLADNGRIAVVFSRPEDHKTLQLKGAAVSVHAAGDADRAAMERYRELLVAALGFVGVPPALTCRIDHWPARAVRFRVDGVFVQTPGPGAGEPLGGRA
jgi:hypothetical protein